jgi:pimeloyl-ACP methyl ester carboxylesterase
MRGSSRIVLLMLALALQPACFIAHLYGGDWPQPVEVFQVRTADGWTLDLRHVSPEGSERHARPVVIMHGLVANGRNMDLDPQHSIARGLARHGFDVWIPSLRNVGASEHRWLPALSSSASDFDVYVTQDLPAVLAEVRARTGAAQVDYVGHSMGGLVLYGYLARGGTGIARAVTLGSPVRFRVSGRWEQLLRNADAVAASSSWMPLHAAAVTSIPLQPGTGTVPERLIMSPENITPAVWHELLAFSVDDVPSALMSQFLGWLREDRFDSHDHEVDYLEGLHRVRIPVLVVAGKIDGIAPPWNVRPAFDALGSPEKEFLVLGEANGQHSDYNHMDMVIGERAPEEVFDRVAEFLSR